MKLIGKGKSDIGQVRDNNEDSFWVDNERGIFVVCDGMGGLEGGDVASQQAIAVVRAVLQKHAPTLEGLQSNEPNTPQILSSIAQEAVKAANEKVFALAKKQTGEHGMGTTLLMLLSCGPHAVMAHVGDSRLYLFREGKVFQLSTDHTLLQEFLGRGYLSVEDAKDHPHGNILLRAVGNQASVDVDVLYCQVHRHDTLLLCSDGLSRYLENSQQLASFLETNELEEIPDALVGWANEQGGRDNITAVVVRLDEDLLKDTVEIPAEEYSEFYHSLQVLEDCFLTRSLSLQGRLRLLNQMQTVTHEAGDVLLSEGDLCERMILVLEGGLDCSRNGQVHRHLSRANDLSAAALLEPITMVETITATEPTTVLLLEGESFRKIVKRKPWLGLKLMRNLSLALGQRLQRAMVHPLQAEA